MVVGGGQALILSLLAGLATCLGALIVVQLDNVGPAHLAFTSAMAGAVMLVLALLDMLLPALLYTDALMSLVVFALGALAFVAFNYVYDRYEQTILVALGFAAAPAPSSGGTAQQGSSGPPPTRSSAATVPAGDDFHSARTLRMGLLTTLTLTAHNFPEGLAVAVSSLDEVRPTHALAVAVAIALHNIPEGLAIATPIYASTRSAWKAFMWTAISGSTEPLGALFALFLFGRTPTEAPLSPQSIQLLMCFVGGVMMAVSCLELIPEALRYKQHRVYMVQGMLLGSFLMLVDLYIFT